METGMEEETYSKIIFIIIGAMAIVVMIIILDIMTGGNLFSSLLCSMVWWLPFSGSNLVPYLNCGSIPL
ncbi:MAG: hypothetical protein JW700_02250 [Candidatus Aenigmarchaeota archaeon]|nr:hypothetical protein [Candidatus Aenigmarchaeota archaeon]